MTVKAGTARLTGLILLLLLAMAVTDTIACDRSANAIVV